MIHSLAVVTNFAQHVTAFAGSEEHFRPEEACWFHTDSLFT